MTRKDHFYLALFFLLPVFYLSGTLTSPESFFARDLTYLFHPWRALSSQMIQSGEMPLWNSYEMGGTPFLANCQSAILYPLTAIFNHLDFAYALKLFHYLHYVLAGIGFYLLAIRMGFRRWTAFVGSIVFSYNGYLLTRLEFLSIIGTIIWLPWIMIFAIQNPDDDSTVLPKAIWCAFTLVLSLFAGYPQLLIFQILFVVLFSFLFNPLKSNLRFWFCAGIFFLLLGTPQLLPTMELIPQSIRGGPGVSYKEAVIYSLPFDSLFGLVYPFRILHHNDRFTGEKFFWIWSAWWGLASTFFLAFSFRFKRKKLPIFLWAIFLTGIVWAMGNYFPWFEWIYNHFFLIRLFRYPPVSLFWSVSAASLLTMCGIAAFSNLPWPIQSRSAGIHRRQSVEAERIPRFGDWRSTASQVGIHGCKSVELQIKKIFLVIGGCLIAFELWNYSRNILPTVTPEYFHFTFPIIKTLRDQPPGTVMLSPRVDRERNLPGTTSIEAKFRFREFLFDLTNLPYRIRTTVASGEPLALQRFDTLYSEMMKSRSIDEARPFFNALNVTHFLTNDSLDKSWTLVTKEGGLKLYRNLDAPGEIIALRNEERKSLSPQHPLLPSTMKIANQKVTAEFDSKEDLFVKFLVPFYPGWKLYCPNGTSSIELKTFPLQNYFTAAALPAGNHKLFLIYEPFIWKLSLMIFAGTAGLIAFGFILKFKTDK